MIETVPLSQVARVLRNGASIKQTKGSTGVPITRIETIADGEINPSRCGYANVSESDFPNHMVKNGDILISHINSTKHLGKCAIYEKSPEKLIHGMNLLLLRVNFDVAHPRYIYRALCSPEFRLQLPKITKHSVNQSSFTVTNFKSLKIPLPSLEEQNRIAAILDKADAVRRKRQRAIELSDQLLRSVFLDMFGDPVTNPKGWEKSQLGDLVRKPITYGILKPGEYVKSGIPMLRIQDIRGGKVQKMENFHRVSNLLSEQYRRTILAGGEIVISLVGTIGLTAIIPKHLSGANLHRNLGLIDLENKLMTGYLSTLMKQPEFFYLLKSSTKGGIQSLLNLSSLKELPIPIPPIKMIEKFLVTQQQIEGEAELAHSFKSEIDLLFRSLTKKALCGEL